MPHFLIRVWPAREGFTPETATPEEISHIGEHWNQLTARYEAGEIVLVGRTTTEPYIGLFVFEAESIEAASKVLNEDAAVANSVFNGAVQPFSLALLKGGTGQGPE